MSHDTSVFYFDILCSVDQPTQPAVPPGAIPPAHPTLSAQTSESDYVVVSRHV